MVRDGHSLPQGRAGLSPEAGKAMAGRSPGGRPLRRRREMRSVYGRQRLGGTAALQAPSDSRCRHRKLTRKQPFSRKECTEEPRCFYEALGKPAVPDSPWKGGRFWMKRTPFCLVMSVWANPSLTCWFIRFSRNGMVKLKASHKAFGRSILAHKIAKISKGS